MTTSGPRLTETPPDDLEQSLDYTRRLWSTVLGWYKSADSKAQVVLALDGAFISFLAGSILAKPDNTAELVRQFGWLTWLLLALMAVTVFGSVVAALACLWSRVPIYWSRANMLSDLRKRLKVDIESTDAYPPKVMFFFQHIARLDRDRFRDGLLKMTRESEIKALADQIHIVSANVTRKHFCVNWSFGFAAMSVLFFLAAAISDLLGR